jgi:hypothetical protein
MNKLRKLVALVVLLLTCMLDLSAYAATVYVANYGDGTASLTNTKAAYDAASPGDTIVFPKDVSATWSSPLAIGKPVTINGNGTTLTASGSMFTCFFNITGFTASSLMRITGFTLTMTDYLQYGIYVHAMTGGVSVGNIRIDNNTFHYGYVQIEYEHGKGLIDNNHFINARKAIAFSAGSRTNADESWASLAAGTADALYIENNHFITNTSYTLTYGQEQIGTFKGGKLVVRYNEFDGDNISSYTATYTPFMAHGNADGGCVGVGYWQYDADTTKCIRRGQSVIEFYNNTMHAKRIDYLYQTRGSVNLVYNNAITGTVTNSPGIYLWEEEYGSNWSATTTHQRTAWPAEDQVHNTFIWNNTYNGSTHFNTASHMALSPNADAGLLQDRDFFLHAPCAANDTTDGYGNTCTHGKATFTGANGASGSYPTDGITYPTKGTMVFTATGDNAYLDYTPYTYPHPLRRATISGGISISGGTIQ